MQLLKITVYGFGGVFITQFTIRIKPHGGESLSSFMLRFSKSNGVRFLTLWKMLKKSNDIYAQRSQMYLLNFTPLNIIDYLKLEAAAGLRETDIFSMTLYYLLKKFSINENLARSRFLLGMLRDERFYYCPLCLKENLYHSLMWNFQDTKLCLKHKIYLTDTCPKCGKSIRQNNIVEIGKCPYCFSSLICTTLSEVQDEEEYRSQIIVQNLLYELLKPEEIKFLPQVLAQKIIYVLNDENKIYNRETVGRNIQNQQLLSTLLQHARDTLSQERIINLKFVVSVLAANRMSFRELYELELPETFINSLLIKPEEYEKESFCKAPWCKNYLVKDSLTEIPTSYHIKSNGDFRSYYFICSECGCEYILKKGNIDERTNFIYAFNLLKDLDLSTKGLNELSEFCKISKDRMIRFLAYFSSNNILMPLERYQDVRVNDMLINKFIEEIRKGTGIDAIRHKKDWNDNYHYLIHRYNNKVMQAVAVNHLDRHENPNLEEKKDIVVDAIDGMLKENIKVTIGGVCERLGIVHETIRLWRCNEIIRDMKRTQNSKKE